jgi:hypothetical protein
MALPPCRRSFIAIFLVVSLLWSSCVFAAQIKLAWDANTEPDLAGYRVYFGMASGAYTNPVGVGNVTQYTLGGLTPGQTYYIALTAFDTSEHESDYSNEVSGIATEPSSGYVAATVDTNPIGLDVVVDGVTFTAPVTFAWPRGSSHTLAVPTPQAESSGTRYGFASWTDGGAVTHSIVAAPPNTTYVADFHLQHSLTVGVHPAEGGAVNPSGTHWYDASQVISLSAVANPEFVFTDWSGDISATGNPASVTLTGPMSVTANFSAKPAVGPDLAGSWMGPVTQSCTKVWSTLRCSVAGALTVVNQGNRDAYYSYVYFYLSDSGVYKETDTAIKGVSVTRVLQRSSTTVRLSYNLPYGKTASGKYLIAVLDKKNSIKETDESNNVVVFGPIP